MRLLVLERMGKKCYNEKNILDFKYSSKEKNGKFIKNNY